MCNVCNSCGNCNGFSNSSTNNGCGGCSGLNNRSATNGCGGCGLFCSCQRMCRDCNGNIHVWNYGYGCNSCDRIAFVGNGVSTTVATNENSTCDDYYARQYALNGRNNRSVCDCGCNGGRNGRCCNRCGCGCG